MSRLPGRGDVVWASMDPTIGREQSKHRPWLVMSEMPLHKTRALVIAVPLTHTDRGWSTHINLTPTKKTPTVAMCEQVRAISVERITRIDSGPYSSIQLGHVHEVLSLLTGGR